MKKDKREINYPVIRRCLNYVTDLGHVQRSPTSSYSTFKPDDPYVKNLDEKKGMDFRLSFLGGLIAEDSLIMPRKLIFFEMFDITLPVDEYRDYVTPICSMPDCDKQESYLSTCISCGKKICFRCEHEHVENNRCPFCFEKFEEIKDE